MTKIDIFSGFLGAGKTTLIKKLLDGGFKGEKIVLIENEFGEIGIDGAFLEDAGVNITEMNSGCICCSLVGDFTKALDKVLKEFSPDRILIEPSGVGKLSDVISAIKNTNNKNIVLNSATTVVDAKKCKMYMKNFGEFFNNQVESAKCIILSHTDSLSEEKLHECIHLLKEKNANATIVSTPWDKLENSQICDAIEGTSSINNDMHDLEEEHHHHHDHEHGEHCCCGHHHEHEHECHHEHHNHHEHCDCHNHEHHHEHGEHCSCGHHHHHEHHEHHHEHHHADEVFENFGIETAKKYEKSEIENILNELSDEKYGTILRAKGYVASGDNNWIYFDYIPDSPDVRDGKPSVIGRICAIGTDLQKEKIKELFKL